MLRRIKENVDVSDQLAISKQIIRMAKSLFEGGSYNPDVVCGVGVASAGPMDVQKGALIKPTNLPLDFVPITDIIEKEMRVPSLLLNDSVAAVLGEKEFGVGKEMDNLFYVTLSTGIGGGAIVDGHLLSGKDGNAVEIGHFNIDYSGKLLCGCGKRGHWEAYCSGRNIPNYINMRLEEMESTTSEKSAISPNSWNKAAATAKNLFEAAKKGDKLALQFVEEIGRLNAVGFADVINAYDPALISVGGAIALENTDMVLPPIKKFTELHTINRVPDIIITPLREDAGLYGGAAAILRATEAKAQ